MLDHLSSEPNEHLRQSGQGVLAEPGEAIGD